MNNYLDKYLKYKTKYLTLKSIIGGTTDDVTAKKKLDYALFCIQEKKLYPYDEYMSNSPDKLSPYNESMSYRPDKLSELLKKLIELNKDNIITTIISIYDDKDFFKKLHDKYDYLSFDILKILSLLYDNIPLDDIINQRYTIIFIIFAILLKDAGKDLNFEKLMNGIPDKLNHIYTYGFLVNNEKERINYFLNICESNYKSFFLEKSYSKSLEQVELFKTKLLSDDKYSKVNPQFIHIIENFRIIKFTDYLMILIKSFIEFLKLKKKYVFLLHGNGTSIKSNLWITLLLLSLFRTEVKEHIKSIIDDKTLHQHIEENFIENNMPQDIFFIGEIDKSIILYCNYKYPDYEHLFCDDATYSGKQLNEYLFTVCRIYDTVISRCYVKLMFFVPFITKKAFDLLKDKLYFFGEFLRLEQFKNLSLDIFEHKMADNMSTFPKIFLGEIFDDKNFTFNNRTLIKECEKIGESHDDTCMKAFYKNSMKNINFESYFNIKFNDNHNTFLSVVLTSAAQPSDHQIINFNPSKFYMM